MAITRTNTTWVKGRPWALACLPELQRRREPWRGRLHSERGVSLIHVAVSIFVLMGFSSVVLDHGVLMLARGQAQNVADMAALAGATARAMDETGANDPAANGITEKTIKNAVDSHKVFAGTGADTGRTWGWNCPLGVVGWCVRVNVFRDGSNGSTRLPVYIAGLLGVNDQAIKATATAVAASANGTDCMKPWLIPDKWLERRNPANTFDPNVSPPGDEYTPYDYQTNTPGTGYSLADIGAQIVLKPGNPNTAISPSDFYEIETAPDYEESIVGCLLTKNIGDTVEALPGNRVGPTNHGVDTLTANGPVDVVIGMFNPADFEAQRRQTGKFTLTIVNMIGVRITGRNGNQVEGVITGGVGTNQGGATPTGVASLIKTISLVR